MNNVLNELIAKLKVLGIFIQNQLLLQKKNQYNVEYFQKNIQSINNLVPKINHAFNSFRNK